MTIVHPSLPSAPAKLKQLLSGVMARVWRLFEGDNAPRENFRLRQQSSPPPLTESPDARGEAQQQAAAVSHPLSMSVEPPRLCLGMPKRAGAKAVRHAAGTGTFPKPWHTKGAGTRAEQGEQGERVAVRILGLAPTCSLTCHSVLFFLVVTMAACLSALLPEFFLVRGVKTVAPLRESLEAV